MITLKEITMDNFREVIELSLGAEDRGMVANNMFSLAEAYADKVGKARAIYEEGTLVGFMETGDEVDGETVAMMELK